MKKYNKEYRCDNQPNYDNMSREEIKEMKFQKDIRSFVKTSIILVAIWLFTGAHFFWPKYVIFWWGLALAIQAISLYGFSTPERQRLEPNASSDKEFI
jgi:Trk-type K+ transport system membrane component